MHVLRRAAGPLRIVLLAALLAAGLPIQAVSAAAADEASDIVLVLDFSGSILEDDATRSSFANALDALAARVDETTARLVAGDATVSIVQFATRARDVPDCTGLQLREDEAAVGALADCLRDVAASYRAGGDLATLRAIGDDTNYVAALEQAAEHLPADSARPAIIFFTDGRHEAPGIPVSDVLPARDQLFGERAPFALLPVGLGVQAEDRPRLEAGLADLRLIREFEGCEGTAFAWPDVVFDTAEAAGQAVGVALQDVSCTFTVEPTPGPSPTPTPSPTPVPGPDVPVDSVRLIPADGAIQITWSPPDDAAEKPVEDYRVRCRPTSGGDWVESGEGVSTEGTATVEGLANGVEHTCEVAVVRVGETEAETPVTATGVPFGRPPPPGKPTVVALDSGAQVTVAMPAGVPVTGFTYECSTDGGSTWAVAREVLGNQPAVDIPGLQNGTQYVCRALAINDSGASDASPVSDAFRPCGGAIDCNPILLPVFGAFVLLLVGALLYALWRFLAGRRVYVTAQVDHYQSISLGRGPEVGMAFVRQGPYQRLAGVVPADGRAADVRIRYAGGQKFEIRSGKVRVKAPFGRQVQITDSKGQPHTIVVRAFDEEPG